MLSKTEFDRKNLTVLQSSCGPWLCLVTPCLPLIAVNVSEDFEHFLELLGERIELKGWQKYRGGLDVKSKFPTS